MFVVLDWYLLLGSCLLSLLPCSGVGGEIIPQDDFVSVAVGLLLPSGSEKSIPYITSR